MAYLCALPTKATSEHGIDVDVRSITSMSDYGSDIGIEDFDIDEDTVLAGVFSTAVEHRPTNKGAILPSIEFEEGEVEDDEHDVDGYVQVQQPTLLRVAKDKSSPQIGVCRDIQSSPVREREVLEVEYDERSRRAWSVPRKEPASLAKPSRFRPAPNTPRVTHAQSPSQAAAESDAQSPLQRFRTKPKKCLSVTDLVSPAWCELQYLYTLGKFGRKPRTQAMRNGSKIHQQLEDEVHTTVLVEVQSKEDRFGLRIWNAISGLRCLRETGITRELEVWGVIKGQVINGVIDELSYTCPDSDFEEQMERSAAEKRGGIVPLPPGQMSISEAFAKNNQMSGDVGTSMDRLESNRLIYLADVKTRSVQSLPTGASLRPTWMQLMLYWRLLQSLSLNTVDAETVFTRYDLGPLETFTQVFMQAVEDIGPGHEASNYPNLLSLWSLLITETQATLLSTNLSPILRAEFRYAKTGDVIGSELTIYSTEVMDEYITEKMDWWKGHRKARGVEIEEAFKCRICDFSEDCTWRKTKVDEATEKSRLRRLAREKSAV